MSEASVNESLVSQRTCVGVATALTVVSSMYVGMLLPSPG
jgi:hypothetical protein